MKHILFIDPIEKLNTKKDSSLMLGLALKNEGHDVFLLFEEDFYVQSSETLELETYEFTAQHAEDGYYLSKMNLGVKKKVSLGSDTILHMRIDPPYDMRYQRYLWMLDFMQYKFNVRITNNPLGIMKHNEKLVAIRESYGVDSFVGSSVSGFSSFISKLSNEGHKEVVLKPMDLYSGIGVGKFPIDDKLESEYLKYITDYGGAVLVQPFMKEVLNGEHRSLYFRGQHLGTIIKIPPKGDFLTNIAQGATYKEDELSSELSDLCEQISNDLAKDGIDFIAFDLLGDKVTEMNVTCPGLIVEVSYACNKNIASDIARLF